MEDKPVEYGTMGAPESEESDVRRPVAAISDTDFSDEDDSIIPKGALDPVYESKARLLNRAVSFTTASPRAFVGHGVSECHC